LTAAIDEFKEILNKIDGDCKFAFDGDLGYITSRPHDLGRIEIEVKV